ncbi:MAG: cohesin domain-containing protein [Candidatus Woykebacteria bacterium]
MLRNIFLGLGGPILGVLLLLIVADKAWAASFSLSPEVISTEAGQEFSVDVYLDTKGVATDGADLSLLYNPEKLEALDVTPGTIYPNYPVKEMGEGKINITALSAATGTYFSGNDIFATVKFRAKLGGEEVIKIDFTNDSTVDSNVATHGKGTDALAEVGESVLYLGGPTSETTTKGQSSFGRIILIVIYIIIVATVAFFGYRYWVKRSRKDEVYVPEEVPMDKPPTA